MPILNGTLLKDADNHTIQLPTGFSFNDGSDALKSSPIVDGTSEIVLKFPSGAIALNVNPVANDVRLYKSSGGVGGYCSIKTGVWFEIPGKPGDVIFLSRLGSTSLEFCFSLIV
jgi:hypothetical protein